MDIKIITIHAMHNPGSVFQAYALQQYLSKQNNVEIIDYRPAYFYSEGNKIKLFLKKLLYGKAYAARSIKFDRFIREKMILTKTFFSYDELIASNISADIFITGSDQLWNSDFDCGKDKAFYLDFVKSGELVSYSTSVGKADIDQDNINILMEELPKFSHLAVRECSTAFTLSKLLNREVSWVADPVFLLANEDYYQFIKKTPIVSGDYAVVYLAPKSQALDFLTSYYRKQGLKIILAGGFSKRCDCDLHIKDVGPEEFLNLIYYSKVVISTSFHATAFCHIFHKDFITILPAKNGERIESLIGLSEMSNKVVKNGIICKNFDDEIDWNYVDKALYNYIEQSKIYLNRICKGK